MALTTTAILLNPTAGGGRAQAIWEELRSDPEVAALPLLVGEDPEDLLRQLDGALDRGLERLIVLGGDGTLHLAANRLLDRRRPEVILGLVPAGTGSDLARHLSREAGLPMEPRSAFHRALSAPPIPLDVLRLTTGGGAHRCAINVLSAGVSGIAGEIVNRGPKRSPFAYMRAAFHALRRYEPVPCRIFLNDEDTPWFEGPLLLLAVANGSSFGKGMQIAPGARTDDGLAEVVAVEPIPLWRIPEKLPRLFRGGVLRLRPVHHRQASRVRLEPSGPLPPFDMDGEVMPGDRAEIEVLPSTLRIAAP
jgi:diacylglycerol kinase (ATP)